MSRETLKDFLNSKGSTSDSISYVRSDKPNGLGKDPETGEELLDLENDVKGLLGDYLKFLIDNSSNEFKIKGGNEKSVSSKKGEDLVLADLQGAEKVFVEQGTTLKSKLNEYSNSKNFDSAGVDLSTLIDKVGKNFSNHEKLQEIKGREQNKYGQTLVNPVGEDNDIVRATQSVLLNNNRFANVGSQTNKSFSEKPQDIQEFEKETKLSNIGTLNSQNKFGEYDKNNKIVSINELKQLGASLLLKSSGFSKASTPGESEIPSDLLADINSLSAKNIDINGGFTQIDNLNLRAKNAKGFPETEAGTSYRDNRGDLIDINTDGDAKNSKSFGATYNSGFRFQSDSIKLHKIQAAISLIALKNIANNFFNDFIGRLRTEDRVQLSTSTEKYAKENVNADFIVYAAGQSRKLTSLRLDNHIFSNLLTNTTYSYGDAVDRGFTVLFGENERNDIEKVSERKIIAQSPGFWIAVSRSILKSFDNIYGEYSVTSLQESLGPEELFTVYKRIIDSNKFIQFFNVLAVIGDISLQSTAGVLTEKLGNKDFKHPRDIDAIPDNRAIPGKSRKNFGSNKNELSWSQDAQPSMYILPANVIRAASRLSNTVLGESPVRGMFGSKLVKSTYTGLTVDGSYNRIPNEVVKAVEDRLDAEYVPFYIQDLRTNEIISFQAFLSSLTDTITPNYNSVSGYGRADAVQVYSGTTRSLNVGFTLFATNREDFDAMWYKINKLVTLLYPQYTPGTMVSNGGDSKFYQPFSQVVGASPIVRLRIGDIIKSNYSRFALARTFGIGDTNVNALPNIDPSAVISKGYQEFRSNKKTEYDKFTEGALLGWLTIFGSPQSIANSVINNTKTPANTYAKIAKNVGRNVVIQGLANILVNGFANPLAVDDIVRQLRDPNQDPENLSIFTSTPVKSFSRNINNSTLLNSLGIESGYQTSKDLGEGAFALRQMILKPNMINGYFCAETGKKYFTPRRLKVRILEKANMANLSDLPGLPSNVIGYKVKVIDPAAPDELRRFGEEQHLVVRHCDILPDPKEFFTNSALGASLFLSDPAGGLLDSALDLVNDLAAAWGVPNEAVDFVRVLYLREEGMFMRPELNPFVRAIHSTRGRGLAGVMGGITFDWLDDAFPWEVDFGARAPMGCKITFNFDVIHDLPPGLDHSGYNKAPLYNVGEIMRNVSGDVYDDDGKAAEFNFREQGGYATRVTGQNNNSTKTGGNR